MPLDLSRRRLIFFGLCGLWASYAFSPALAEIFFSLTFTIWLIDKFQSRQFRISMDSRVAIPLLVYFGFCLVSVIFSDLPDRSLRGILKVGQQIITFFMTLESMKEKLNFNFFQKVMLIFALILCLDGWYQYAMGKDLIRGFAALDASAGVRLTASFKAYGLFAAYLLMTIPILFFVGIDKVKNDKGALRWAMLAFTLSGLCSLMLFFTRSRGAFLAFFLGLFVLLFVLKKFKWLMLVGVAIIGFCLLLPPSMVIHLDAEMKEQSIVERYYLWDRAIQVIKAKPLTGAGINTYSKAHAYYDKTKNWRVVGYYAHNGYLQMAAEIGLLGLFSFLLFLVNFFKYAPLKILLENPLLCGIATGLINFLLFAGVDTVLHNPQSVNAFWFLLGVLGSQTQLVNKVRV